MLNVSQDIHSLTEFKTRTPEFLERIREHEGALLLTVNGRAELAVMSAATFQRVLEALDALDALAGVHEGLEDLRIGRTRDAGAFLKELRKKKKLPKRR